MRRSELTIAAMAMAMASLDTIGPVAISDDELWKRNQRPKRRRHQAQPSKPAPLTNADLAAIAKAEAKRERKAAKRRAAFWCDWCASGTDKPAGEHTADCGRPENAR